MQDMQISNTDIKVHLIKIMFAILLRHQSAYIQGNIFLMIINHFILWFTQNE